MNSERISACGANISQHRARDRICRIARVFQEFSIGDDAVSSLDLINFSGLLSGLKSLEGRQNNNPAGGGRNDEKLFDKIPSQMVPVYFLPRKVIQRRAFQVCHQYRCRLRVTSPQPVRPSNLTDYSMQTLPKCGVWLTFSCNSSKVFSTPSSDLNTSPPPYSLVFPAYRAI
jgi:hypothetical protein